LGEKRGDALVKFYVIVAGDDISCMTLDRCFNNAVVFRIAASPDVSGKQHVFAASSMRMSSSRMSALVMPYLSLILGRLRTSAIFAIMGSQMTARKSPLRKELRARAGNPSGFRIADTQILVSRTALIATLLFPDFLYRMGDV